MSRIRTTPFPSAPLALVLVPGLLFLTGCQGTPPADPVAPASETPTADPGLITYEAVGNDGGEWTTTSVALTFSAGIQAEGQDDKLSAENIVRFDDGGTGATVGEVNGRGNGWSFDLTGVTRSGTISFAIEKDGFDIDPTVRTLEVVHSTSVPGTWPAVDITPRAEDASAFALIDAGSFAANDPGDSDRPITLTRSFYLGTTEVTQAQFEGLMGANKSQILGEDLPVTDVTWYDAAEFCNRLSVQAGLDPVYTIVKSPQDALNTNDRDTYKFTVTWDQAKDGYRLPTLAEWEYAMRAGTQSLYFTGDDESTLQGYANLADSTYSVAYDDTAEVTLGVDDGFADTAPVASLQPNAWGLYDMIGNVAEWTWDWQVEYDDAAYPLTDPTGLPADVEHDGKVARGGSYNNAGSFLTSAGAARAFPASAANGTVGFRVARTVS